MWVVLNDWRSRSTMVRSDCTTELTYLSVFRCYFAVFQFHRELLQLFSCLCKRCNCIKPVQDRPSTASGDLPSAAPTEWYNSSTSALGYVPCRCCLKPVEIEIPSDGRLSENVCEKMVCKEFVEATDAQVKLIRNPTAAHVPLSQQSLVIDEIGSPFAERDGAQIEKRPSTIEGKDAGTGVFAKVDIGQDETIAYFHGRVDVIGKMAKGRCVGIKLGEHDHMYAVDGSDGKQHTPLPAT